MVRTLMSLKHNILLSVFRKGLRNGTWRRLSPLDKAFFKAAIAYSKLKGRIVNLTVLKKVLGVVEKLISPLKREVWRRGLEIAHYMSRLYEERGVFSWCSRLRYWLSDPEYIFYLGATYVNLPLYWRRVLSPM